jgi:uncharacterized membrane protein
MKSSSRALPMTSRTSPHLFSGALVIAGLFTLVLGRIMRAVVFGS